MNPLGIISSNASYCEYLPYIKIQNLRHEDVECFTGAV